MFEQFPLRDGRQSIQDFRSLTQTQFLQLPEQHRQQRGAMLGGGVKKVKPPRIYLSSVFITALHSQDVRTIIFNHNIYNQCIT